MRSPGDPNGTVSLRLAASHRLNPGAHLTGELRLGSNTSVAAMVGAGRVSSEGDKCGLFEAGTATPARVPHGGRVNIRER